MRWILPKVGDERLIEKFLLLPRFNKNSTGESEWRWLEFATIHQKRVCMRRDIEIWQDIGWVNK